MADDFEELIDLAASFYFLPPVSGNKTGVIGGTGGTSVLAADECEKAGLEVIPFPAKLKEELKDKRVSIWDWLSNPVDLSIREDQSFTAGTILEMMARYSEFDLLIATMGTAGRFNLEKHETYEEHLREQYCLDSLNNKPFLTVVQDRTSGISEWGNREAKMNASIRSALINLKLPFYPTITRAAVSAKKLVDYYRRSGELE